MFVNGTKVLGPTTFAFGFEFAEEQFTTCSCSCNIECQSLQRSCCVSEKKCGQCLPGFNSFKSANSSCVQVGKYEQEEKILIVNSDLK